MKNLTHFPLSIVYQDKKSPQRERPDHMHDYYEIVYVYSGKGVFFIGDVSYDMQQGDLFLIPANTIHRAMPDQNDPVMSSILFFSSDVLSNNPADDEFSYLTLFKMAKFASSYKMALQEYTRERIEKYLLLFYQETQSNEPGSNHAVLLILQQIILDLYRIRQKNKDDIETNRTYDPEWMADIITYINAHLHEHLSLTVLADKSLVSPSHFSRVFKNTTGIGVVEYLNKKRVIKAKELLLETSYSVSMIAEKCGFESISHFHRIFKKYTHLTPAGYRKTR